MNLNNIRAKNNTIMVSRYQTAPEIASAIIKAIKESETQANELAPYFENRNKLNSLKLMFLFCKKSIPRC